MSAIPGAVIDFGILIIGAMILGGVAVFFRQPLIVAYIATGILLGGQGLALIHDPQYLYEISSELGIAMLLFVVGLELSIKKMLDVRRVVVGGTLAYCILFVIIGLFTGYALGFTWLEGVYLGLVIAFASTLLIVKGLGEKHQVDSLLGRILVGSLVFEDILVIITISILGVVAGVEPTGFVSWFTGLPGVSLIPYIGNITLFVGALILLATAYLLNKFVARYLFRFFSSTPEMLFVSSLGFCFGIAFLAAELGFSVAIGAFIAGVIVANTDYYLDVLGRVRTLATFFALLFFSTLGFNLTFENFTSLLVPVLVITLIVVIVKPLIIGFLVRLFGYDKTTAIGVGLHMSQVSEFSLILIAFGIKFGHVRESFLTITIFVLLLSFLISMYYIKYTARLTAWLQRRFRSLSQNTDQLPEVGVAHATCVIYGVEHIDDEFLNQVRAAKPQLVVVDPDPDSASYVRDAGIPVIIGSADNEEVLERLPIENLELVISTIPDFEQNLHLLEHVRKHNKTAVVIASALSMHEAIDLYHHGASYVRVSSFMDDGVTQHILAGKGVDHIESARTSHITRLERIVKRSSTAVDIDEFVARLTHKTIREGTGAIKRGADHGVKEVDKVLDNFRTNK